LWQQEVGMDSDWQTVLVLQGGGALGAYQYGVIQALHESRIEPDWVIGTSMGAINGAIVAGNPAAQRMERLACFWDRMASSDFGGAGLLAQFWQSLSNLQTLTWGVPGLFGPNPAAILGPQFEHGIERASYYSTGPMSQTLRELVDFDRIEQSGTRLTVGAVNARNGTMKYFDSRHMRLAVEHVLASGALPPAFPAVRIDGEPYWDGGIYSNTPMEVVFDDNPRRDALIFDVHLWNPVGPEPRTLLDVQLRQKDIQYASRIDSHLTRQQQIHRLRHVIMELARQVAADAADSEQCRSLARWGCSTRMHVIRLMAPRLDSEDHAKDIDFSRAGIDARREAGYRDTRRALQQQPWTRPVDPLEGIIVHDFENR
jgi:NTE family protein